MPLAWSTKHLPAHRLIDSFSTFRMKSKISHCTVQEINFEILMNPWLSLTFEHQGVTRLSFMHYNTLEEVERVVEVIKTACSSWAGEMPAVSTHNKMWKRPFFPDNLRQCSIKARYLIQIYLTRLHEKTSVLLYLGGVLGWLQESNPMFFSDEKICKIWRMNELQHCVSTSEGSQLIE